MAIHGAIGYLVEAMMSQPGLNECEPTHLGGCTMAEIKHAPGLGDLLDVLSGTPRSHGCHGYESLQTPKWDIHPLATHRFGRDLQTVLRG